MTNPKRPRDTNQLAKLIADIATGEVTDAKPDEGKNEESVKAGRKGGLKGGPARKAALTDERRVEIAKRAAEARWGK